MISPYSFLKSKIRSLEISAGDLGLTPCSCAVIVTDVKTGKVKALTSYPSYDNNKFANSVDADYYAKISTSSASPLLNRATQQKAAPGSTFKMVTATTALEEGIINPYTRIHYGVQFKKINNPCPIAERTTSTSENVGSASGSSMPDFSVKPYLSAYFFSLLKPFSLSTYVLCPFPNR